MTGYAAIRLLDINYGSILASLSDTSGAEGRFIDACLRFPYDPTIPVYFVRGNYTRQMGMHDFSEHLLTEDEFDKRFTTAKTKDGSYRPKPDSQWFVATVIELENKVKCRGELNFKTVSAQEQETGEYGHFHHHCTLGRSAEAPHESEHFCCCGRNWPVRVKGPSRH